MSDIPLVGQHWARDRVDMIKSYLEELVEQLDHHKQSLIYINRKIEDHIKMGADESDPSAPSKVNMIFVELLNTQSAMHCTAISQVTGQLALMACMGVEDMPRVNRPESPEEKLN